MLWGLAKSLETTVRSVCTPLVRDEWVGRHCNGRAAVSTAAEGTVRLREGAKGDANTQREKYELKGQHADLTLKR